MLLHFMLLIEIFLVYSSSSSSDNEICDGGFGNDDFDSLTEDFKLNLLNESPLSLAI